MCKDVALKEAIRFEEEGRRFFNKSFFFITVLRTRRTRVAKLLGLIVAECTFFQRQEFLLPLFPCEARVKESIRIQSDCFYFS